MIACHTGKVALLRNVSPVPLFWNIFNSQVLMWSWRFTISPKLIIIKISIFFSVQVNKTQGGLLAYSTVYQQCVTTPTATDYLNSDNKTILGLRWLNRLIRSPKSLFKYGEERSIVCDCAHEEKIIF